MFCFIRKQKVCPPRLPQLAMAPILPLLRTSLRETRQALRSRLQLFERLVNAVPGWHTASTGGYFAYVQYPDAYGSHNTSETVAARLAKECGVLVLPGCWCMPEKGSEEWKLMERVGSDLTRDRWLR